MITTCVISIITRALIIKSLVMNIIMKFVATGLRLVHIMNKDLRFFRSCQCFLCKHDKLHQMQRIMRIGSNSIFASAALHLTNQFSEFYHNTTDTTQGFASLCEPSLNQNNDNKLIILHLLC